MGLDHRIQELLLDGPRTEAELFRGLGPVGSPDDWTRARLHQRLVDLQTAGRVRAVGYDDFWTLARDGARWNPPDIKTRSRT